MQTSKDIYIVRHGQTDYNKNGIVQGSLIDASLNDTGRRQAGLFYDRYKNHSFDKLYTSNLKRSIESVQGFIDDGLDWEKQVGLNEISWGDYDGKKIVNDGYYWQVVEQWNAGNVEVSTMNGESPVDVWERQTPVVELIKKEKADSLLICMHGRAMRILLCQLLGLPLKKMDGFAHHNLGLYKIHFDGISFSILEENDISHLE